MTLSKKEKLKKLISSLEALKIKEINTLVIPQIKAVAFSRDSDLNATLTRILFEEVFVPYPNIMGNPKSQALKRFCEQEIGPIKPESALQSTPKIKR